MLQIDRKENVKKNSLGRLSKEAKDVFKETSRVIDERTDKYMR